MAPDCEHPKCHEEMSKRIDQKVSYDKFNILRDCVTQKITKKTLWIAFAVIGLPLFVTGIKVWSQQESDALRYADKRTVEQIRRDQSEFRATQKHILETLRGMKDGQKESTKDIKEILKRLK